MEDAALSPVQSHFPGLMILYRFDKAKLNRWSVEPRRSMIRGRTSLFYLLKDATFVGYDVQLDSNPLMRGSAGERC